MQILKLSPPTGKLTGRLLLRTLVIMLMFVLLAVVLIVSTTRLERMAQELHQGIRVLNQAHELEINVLAQRRNTLQYLVYNDSTYLEDNKTLLAAADTIVMTLSNMANSAEELETAQLVTSHYTRFRGMLAEVPELPTPSLQRTVDQLLAGLEQFRAINLEQMEATRQKSVTLNSTIDTATITILPLLAIILLLSTFRFWQQIFVPLARIDAAARRLTGGESEVRVPVSRSDELGTLSEAFNSLADALTARDVERSRSLAVVAHDLRAPLTVIGGMNELLPHCEIGRRNEYHAAIARQCRRLEGMTLDLLETVRIESGRVEMNLVPVNLANLIHETVAEQRELLRDRTIDLQAMDDCPVNGDALRLSRVISNLLSNAIKYSPAELPVRVTLTATAGKARMTIADHGPGMTTEEIRHLFQPFNRLERTARQQVGTGLGLYSVRQLIIAHGGTVCLESAPGCGTTAVVELPLAPPSG